jgi:hypothetical protein
MLFPVVVHQAAESFRVEVAVRHHDRGECKPCALYRVRQLFRKTASLIQVGSIWILSSLMVFRDRLAVGPAGNRRSGEAYPAVPVRAPVSTATRDRMRHPIEPRAAQCHPQEGQLAPRFVDKPVAPHQPPTRPWSVLLRRDCRLMTSISYYSNTHLLTKVNETLQQVSMARRSNPAAVSGGPAWGKRLFGCEKFLDLPNRFVVRFVQTQ